MKRSIHAPVSSDQLESFSSIFGPASLIGVRKRGPSASHVRRHLTEFELRPINSVHSVQTDLRGIGTDDVGTNDLDSDYYNSGGHLTGKPNFVRLSYDLTRRKLTVSVKASVVVASSELEQVANLMQLHSIDLHTQQVHTGLMVRFNGAIWRVHTIDRVSENVTLWPLRQNPGWEPRVETVEWVIEHAV